MLDKRCINSELIESFSHLISQHSGIIVRQQDQNSLNEKIFARMQANKIKNQKKYYDFLNSKTSESSQEWEKFTSLLVNNESYFFRDREQLSTLNNKIFPELIKRKRAEKTIRVCSAGCSTGQEPYTLAVLLKELLPDFNEWNVLILGIDIDRQALVEAAKGIYETWSFRGVSEKIKRKYFQEINSQYYIEPDIKKNVQFQLVNLAKDTFPQHKSELKEMDLILCRNVFIYFENSATAKVLEKIYKTLQPLGYFIAGHTELAAQDLSPFDKIYLPGSVVYQRPLTDKPRPNLVNNSNSLQIQKSNLDSSSYTAHVNKKTSSNADFNLSLKSLVDKNKSSVVESKTNSYQLNTEKALNEVEKLLSQEKYELAIAQIQQVLKIDPQNAQAHCHLAQVYANLGQYNLAVQFCRRGLEIDCFAIAPYFLMAKVAEEQGDLDEAKRILKKIIYLDPKSAIAYSDLSHLYMQEGDEKRAQKMQEAAMDILKELPSYTKPIEEQS